MCGICAIVGGGVRDPEHRIGDMLKKLSHRGPDGYGMKVLEGCSLGHSRLSIIDLESGSQPMSELTGRYWITYNGEVYNYRAIREQLIAKGYIFNTHSDTEVVLNSYIEWGRDCLEKFRGMFSFAIWDNSEKKLFAARDIFGEKPFYFSVTTSGSLVIASEIKSLLASNVIEPILDLSSVDNYLAFGYILPNKSIYKNISVLPPGHFLEWNNGNEKITEYWKPDLSNQKLITLEDASLKLRELLTQAVGRQMVADVPVGAFLSGGLDSSTIVALMRQHSSAPIMTFSAGFGEHINELPYARAVAEKYGTDHHELDFGEPDVAFLLEEMAEVYDEPFADSSNIPTYLIAKFAAKNVKVVLTGDGGDELFGGYWWHRILAQSENISPSRIKWILCRLTSKLMKDRFESFARYSVALGWHSKYADVWERDIAAQIAISVKMRKDLWGERGPDVHEFPIDEYYKPNSKVDGINRALYFDMRSYLPGDILTKVDRAAMANSLETRAPFLDKDVVEFASSLPSQLKVSADESKIILNNACMKYWPEELRNRKKQGFGAPYNIWLKRPDVLELRDAIFAKESKLSTLLPGFSRTKKRAPYETWLLLNLGLWLEKHKVIV